MQAVKPISVLALAACAAVAGCGRAPEASPASAPIDAAWVARTALYEVFVRDFSPEGTFRGVIAGLDRIEAVGAQTVWLMPVQPNGVERRKGTLGSPYAIRDYRGLHPDYGTGEDFRALVEAVHARGMKLIIDWVPNHTAWDHAWVTERPYFYTRDEAGQMTVPRDNDGKPTDWTDVVELDYDNPAMRRAMVAEMRYWLEEFGIDGFRVDVAGMVPDAFWREAIPELRSVGPILLLAEWGEPKMHELGFDLTYAWNSYHRLKDAWNGGPASAFVAAEVEELRELPVGAFRMRFSTNHDETAWDAPPVELFGGSAGARAAFATMALLPGPPLVYNGQEVESAQRLPLFEREPVAWDQPGADAGRDFHRRVITLSRTHAAFTDGALRAVATDADTDVIAYARGDALVLVNTRDRAVRVTPAEWNVDGARDLLGGGTHAGAAVDLPPHGVAVLEVARRAMAGRVSAPVLAYRGR
jgi:glycosidase